MNLIVQMIVLLYLFLIVPFLIGILETCIFRKNHKRISEMLSDGYLGMMAGFCVISIFAIQMEWALSQLAFVWAIIAIVISILAILFGRKQIKGFFREVSEFWKGKEKLKYRFLLMLICFVVVSIFFTRPDAEDDTWEIVHTAVETDTMYLYDEYSGYLSTEAIEGHTYSPIEMLYAVAVALTGISETVALYYIVPICLLFFFYMGLWRIGIRFLKNTESSMVFVGFACVIYWMTTYLKGQSVVTGIFLNSWNGLTILSCLVMPMVLSSLLQWMEIGQKNSNIRFGKLELCYRSVVFLLAGQLTNEKGGFYIFLMLIVTIVVIVIKKMIFRES